MKKKNIIIVLLILSISIGFAILSSNLSIGSSLTIADASFDVHFDNVAKVAYTAENDTYTYSENNTILNFEIPLDKPGEYADYKIYVVNAGTIDAVLDTFTVTIPSEVQNYLNYSLTYYNGTNPISGDLLRKGTNIPLKLHVEYKYDVDNFIPLETSTVTVSMSYKQPQSVDNKYVWEFDYQGAEQPFTVPKTGTYKLEVWGAQGGSYNETYFGGYGGYSVGNISLEKNTNIYLNIGGTSSYTTSGTNKQVGGYNGGGTSLASPSVKMYCSPGGGATHISYDSGLLSTLENKKSGIIIVAGGGGGSIYHCANDPKQYCGPGGSGGGITGSNGILTHSDTGYTYSGNATGGTQESGGLKMSSSSSTGFLESESGLFGQGGNALNVRTTGGGGGYYGGASATRAPAAGGSGYIGNTNLTDKSMYCYNCTESSETATKTISTTNVSETPTSNYAKIGNGYARITLIN